MEFHEEDIYQFKKYSIKSTQKLLLPALLVPEVLEIKCPGKDVKINYRQYANVVLKEFANIIPGVYAISRKDDRHSNLIIELKCNDKECAKNYRLVCPKTSVVSNEDVSWAIESDNKICSHADEPPRNRNVSGAERNELKEKLKVKPISVVHKELIEKDLPNIGSGTTIVPNKNVLRMIRSEVLSEKDLDKNVIIDVVQKSMTEEFKFIDLSINPFRCKLVSERQIKAVINYAEKHKNKLRRFNFDATGSIFQKVPGSEHELMTYVLIFPLKTNECNRNHLQFNIAEFISETQTSFAVQQFLSYVANEIKMLSSDNLQLIHEIVVDWSWAEINAVIKAFNNLSAKEYLSLTFNIITLNETAKLKGLVVLLECSSHLTKTMKKEVKKYFQLYETRKVIYEMLGKIFECETWAELLLIIESFVHIVTRSSFDGTVKNSLKTMEAFKKTSSSFDILDHETSDNSTFPRRDEKEIYKDSPFYQVNFFNYLINYANIS